ncbi:MAG: hypothetical protein ACFFDI_10330, partial [Promethearchaeota archaeon]
MVIKPSVIKLIESILSKEIRAKIKIPTLKIIDATTNAAKRAIAQASILIALSDKRKSHRKKVSAKSQYIGKNIGKMMSEKIFRVSRSKIRLPIKRNPNARTNEIVIERIQSSSLNTRRVKLSSDGVRSAFLLITASLIYSPPKLILNYVKRKNMRYYIY